MKTAKRWVAGALVGVAGMAWAGDGPRPLPLGDVTVRDGFWSAKRSVWRATTLNDCFDKFEKDGTLVNFDRVRDGTFAGLHNGEPWFDGLLYEMITASADFLANEPDAALRTRVDSYIARIAAAAARQPDGYLNTYTQAKEPTHRWGTHGGNDRYQHDLYNAGCLVEAAVHYYRATGDTTLLRTAVTLANTMCDVMGPASRQNIIPGHAIPELAFFELSQLIAAEPTLKDKLGVPADAARYKALAEFWVDARGHHDGRSDTGAYNQDHVPVADQATIEGHAVRAVLLGTGMAKIGREGGRPDLTGVAQRWWQNMVGRRAYVTGGIGASAEDEKFASDFVLPNTGYAETCAAVGKAFLDDQIFQQTADAAAVDEFERSLYNGALTGVSLAGTSYFYENPLAATPDRNRWTWHGCPCCPPMFLKLMSAMPSRIYATGDRGLYVNLFVGSTAHATVGSNAVTVTQTTGYPWTGDVTLKVDPKQAAQFAVNVRVPGWCRDEPADALYRSDRPAMPDAFKLAVNGRPADYTVDHGYARIDRQWQAGDTVTVQIDVSPRRLVAQSAVEADRGRVALAAGPIIYCLESTDQASAVDRLSLPADGGLRSEYRGDLLGGVSVLRGPAVETAAGQDAAPTEFTAVPFFATANRGPRTMEVWVPVAK